MWVRSDVSLVSILAVYLIKCNIRLYEPGSKDWKDDRTEGCKKQCIMCW
jgi:hypothetical protein